MTPNPKRSSYSDAIERVRSQHAGSVKPARVTLECPRCRTVQVVTDVPEMRRCVKCGYEFRRLV